LNKHLEELIELSKLDKSIDDFTPLIEASAKKLARRTQKRDEIAQRISKLNLSVEDATSKIASFEEQIKALNEQLILGVAKEKAVKNEKEMKALQMEAELAKEKLKFANEEIDRHNEILDKKESEFAEVNKELKVANEELDKISTEVSAKMASIEEDKSKLFAIREKKTMAIDQKILSFYEKIRVWAKNTAVVPVRKQACYGCYMKLNDSAYAEVIKSEDICTCHHCGRILFVEPQTVDTKA
jgi:predicted  nucleic acid-binding Zn-ribbon protein